MPQSPLVENMRTVQTSSADATRAHRLEKPVAMLYTLPLPLAGWASSFKLQALSLDHILLGKGSYQTYDQSSPIYVCSLFSFHFRPPALHPTIFSFIFSLSSYYQTSLHLLHPRRQSACCCACTVKFSPFGHRSFSSSHSSAAGLAFVFFSSPLESSHSYDTCPYHI